MRKFIFIFFSMVLFGFAANAMAADDPPPVEKQEVTDEDKEIAEALEMLELMDMLENLEMIKDYHLFAEEETDEKEN